MSFNEECFKLIKGLLDEIADLVEDCKKPAESINRCRLVPCHWLIDIANPILEGRFATIRAAGGVGKSTLIKDMIYSIGQAERVLGLAPYTTHLILVNERDEEIPWYDEVNARKMSYSLASHGLVDESVHLVKVLREIVIAVKDAALGNKRVVLFIDSLTRVYESLTTYFTGTIEPGGIFSDAFRKLHALTGSIYGFYEGGGSITIVGSLLMNDDSEKAGVYSALANRLGASTSCDIVLDKEVMLFPKISSESKVRLMSRKIEVGNYVDYEDSVIKFWKEYDPDRIAQYGIEYKEKKKTRKK